ncbi:uncharacterized protein LOC143285672 isoform X2 [Babylonia areolata]|uniref:uncharacterized protein LOC143285672 isoform X2 n=1 Tax=Babylonia areolata TaxID=304850 RepID=UPI003FD146F5
MYCHCVHLGGVCPNGKPMVREEATGRLLCLCHLGGHPHPHPSSPSLPPPPAPHPHHPHALPPHHPAPRAPHPHPLSKGPSPPSSTSSTTTTSSPSSLLGLPVQVPLPPFTAVAARGALGSDPLCGTGVSKDYLSTRAIPLGGPYTAAAIAAYHPYLYAGYDMGVRKTAVRETTAPLKAWLHEHRKNPYPTKAEKIMLAIITQMTLTQVSTWFANARRRLKKEGGGGQWDNVSDGDTACHDTPSDTPTHEKDGSSLGDNYEDLSDVSVEDSDDLPHHQPPPPPPPQLLLHEPSPSSSIPDPHLPPYPGSGSPPPLHLHHPPHHPHVLPHPGPFSFRASSLLHPVRPRAVHPDSSSPPAARAVHPSDTSSPPSAPSAVHPAPHSSPCLSAGPALSLAVGHSLSLGVPVCPRPCSPAGSDVTATGTTAPPAGADRKVPDSSSAALRGGTNTKASSTTSNKPKARIWSISSIMGLEEEEEEGEEGGRKGGEDSSEAGPWDRGVGVTSPCSSSSGSPTDSGAGSPHNHCSLSTGQDVVTRSGENSSEHTHLSSRDHQDKGPADTTTTTTTSEKWADVIAHNPPPSHLEGGVRPGPAESSDSHPADCQEERSRRTVCTEESGDGGDSDTDGSRLRHTGLSDRQTDMV